VWVVVDREVVVERQTAPSTPPEKELQDLLKQHIGLASQNAAGDESIWQRTS